MTDALPPEERNVDDAAEFVPICRGIRVSRTGEVLVDPKLEEPLTELAMALMGPEDLPVDVEHVVAALMLVSREGQIPPDYELRPKDRTLKALLRPQVKMLFRRFGGAVCEGEANEGTEV